jgi:hypothetical protein
MSSGFKPGFIDALMRKWLAQHVCDDRLFGGLLTDAAER